MFNSERREIVLEASREHYDALHKTIEALVTHVLLRTN